MFNFKVLAIAIAVSSSLIGSVQAENTFAKPPTFWWPERIDLTPLRQHNPDSNPYGADFNYAAEFAEVDTREKSPAGRFVAGDRPQADELAEGPLVGS